MKNDEKVDIKVSSGSSDYDTALRYINIAEHMKQFEDQDKYIHRAVQFLEKANVDGSYTEQIEELKRKKFGIRAQGKVNLYEEASRIRDNAKTPQDYYSAQTLFHRIHAYEAKHPIPEKWVEPELYTKTLNCVDSKEQEELCEKLANNLESAEKRSSLFASIAVVIIVAAVVLFSRTTMCRRVLATAFSTIGDYTSAYQKYNAVYERTGEEAAYQSYLDARYKAAMKELSGGEKDLAYTDLKAIAKDNFQDSQHQFFLLELEYIKDAALSDKVQFANMDWRILEIQDDRVLLIKDNALGSTPFNETAGDYTWANSSLRTWLNETYLSENFYEDEINAILTTEVVTEANPYYEGTNGSETTQDKLFLLSIAEEEKYFEQLHETNTCWWLRTPGANAGSAAFVYRNKEVMPYGYDVTNKEITVKPAIWVSLESSN